MAKNYTWEKFKFKVKEGYYHFRKPLTAKQKLEYTTRFGNGENGAEILRDMGVKFW